MNALRDAGDRGHALSSSLAAVGLLLTLQDRMYKRTKDAAKGSGECVCPLAHAHAYTYKYICVRVCIRTADGTGRGPETAKGASLEETDESSSR